MSITVELPAAPTAPNYSESTAYDTPLVIGAPAGVLSNASGTQLQATLATGPADGTVHINTDGSYTYTPTTGFTGTDSFTYRVTDGFARTTTGKVSIVVAASGAPNAPNYSETTPFQTPLQVSGADGVLSGATGSGISISGHSTPAHGTLSLDPSNGSYTYTPSVGYAGPDSFTYTVTDTLRQTATGTVSVAVVPPAPPVAADYTESTPEGSVLTVTTLNGVGSDDTGTELTYSLTGDPLHGTASRAPRRLVQLHARRHICRARLVHLYRGRCRQPGGDGNGLDHRDANCPARGYPGTAR